MTTLREFLGTHRRLASGPCPACGATGAAPMCESCRTRSGMADVAIASVLGRHALHFTGAYHHAEDRGLTPLGISLRAFKDHGDRYAGRCLARLFATTCSSLVSSSDVIVPVPSDLDRLRRRGFSPAAWLARALSRSSGVPMNPAALIRVTGRPPQRGLGGIARRSNAAGAFTLGARHLRGYAVALTDDVVTTGATLQDAARCLLDAGASKVTCIVLACADNERTRACRSKTGLDGNSDTGS